MAKRDMEIKERIQQNQAPDPSAQRQGGGELEHLKGVVEGMQSSLSKSLDKDGDEDEGADYIQNARSI